MPGAADVPGQRDYPESSRPLDQPEPPARLQDRLGNLPDGHPSSPRDEDGSWRAPAISLKDLELPIEDTPTEPAAPPDTTSDAWRDGMPALQAAWERHLERWPETERPPVDRSTDEPGSWRGDGGQYLNTEENLVTDHALTRISKAAPEVTTAMEAIADSVPGAKLFGLEHCIKGPERYKEKVAEDLRAMPDRSAGEIIDGIPDAVRYTYQFSADRYAAGYRELCERASDAGNEMTASRNFWASTQYKGINTRWSTSDGQLFEVQVHTPESFEAKELTHGAYERMRNIGPESSERKELYDYQELVSRKIPTPPGALDIKNYRREDI